METRSPSDGTARTGEARAGVPESAEAVDLEQLAQRVVAAYENAGYLSFDMTVWQEGTKPGREPAAPREVAWAITRMAPGRLRTEIYRSKSGEHLLDFVDDGTAVTEAAATRQVQHPERDPQRGRDILLADAADFDGCLVGNLIQSWLGGDTRAVRYLSGRVRAGRCEGREVVDGHECYVVSSETGAHRPNSLHTRHRLWIDAEAGWLRKRVASQTAYSASGDLLQVVTRTSLFRNIRTDPLDEHTFAPATPFGPPAATDEEPKPPPQTATPGSSAE